MTRRRYPLGFTLFTMFGVSLMLLLGTWQVQRMLGKDELISQRTQALAQPPVALSEIDRAEMIPYRRVIAEGRYLHDKSVYLLARVHDGKLGRDVVTPLALADGSVLLVNRGWVPPDYTGPAAGAREEVSVQGILKPTSRRGMFMPANDPAAGDWYRVSIPEIAKHTGLDNVRPYYLEAGPTASPGGYPIGGYTPVDRTNRHLIFAISWYALGAALVMIYVQYLRRRT